MPSCEAVSLTAVRSAFGKRIFTRSLFFANSKCTGLNCEKSYSDRSASSTNFSASSSVLNVGKGLRSFGAFIGLHLFAVHVTGRKRPDKFAFVVFAQRENNKHVPLPRSDAYGVEPRFGAACAVGKYERVMAENLLD